MGAYINPEDMTKEEWLEKYATPLNEGVAWNCNDFALSHLMVCLVNNGPFSAAAIMYSEEELRDFRVPMDLRPKKWFVANIEDLKKVSPELPRYLKNNG